MGILYVGGDLNYKTIGAALAAATQGDVVVVREGVYHEALVVDKAVTIEADGDVTLDGRYGAHLYGDGSYTTSKGRAVKGGQLPALTPGNAARGQWVHTGTLNTSGYSALVRLTSPGAVVRGLTLRNAPGRFVVFESDNGTVADCRMDFCYGGAIRVSPGATENRLTGCTISRGSVKAHDPGAPGAGPASVATTVIDAGVDTLIQSNTIFYCYGEGVSADKGSVGSIIRDNTVFGCAHWGIGINGATVPSLLNNIVYWPDNVHEAMGKSGPADCCVIGAEQATADDPKKAALVSAMIRGNLFVGGKRAFVLGGTGRPVQFLSSEISNNTIIGRVVSAGVGASALTWTCLPKAQHRETVVCNNVVIWQSGRDGVSYQAGGNVQWRENVYTSIPAKGMMGDADVVGYADVLGTPYAHIEGAFDPYALDMPDGVTTFDIDNYRPLPDGPARRGEGYDGALVPDEPVEPPDGPEPPERVPDWERMLSLLASAEVAVVGMAGLLHEIDGRMTALHEARARVAASMNELTVLIESEKER